MLSSVCQKWPSDRSGSAGNRGDCSVSYTTRWDTIRDNISRSFAVAVKSVSATLAIYDNAYKMLTQKSDPQVFKDFLLSAPELFNTLGERLGAVEHLLSFWRFRVPEGKRSQLQANELIDIFGDFETSLEVKS